MLKHIGKHNNKKVVLLYRQVPNEDHMCLVVYSDLLPRIYHDSVMQILESPAGQQASSLSDVLFRNMMPDGKNCLEALHREGLIKKVPTNQIIVTPNTISSIRLDELNKILDEMAKGEEATKKLANLEKDKGISGKRKTAERNVGEPAQSQPESVSGVLSDSDLARQRLTQAAKMKADAERLLKEAELLTQEAVQLDPGIVINDSKKKSPVKSKKS
jgi:hypothetical protein